MIKNTLIALFLLIVVVAAGIAFFVSNNLDGYIAKQIEVKGSAALGSKVSVSRVKTSLADGSAHVSGLSIANPAGYSSKNAVEIDSFMAKIDYQSQVIEQINIEKPIINAEIAGEKNNFQELLDNMPESDDAAEKSAEEDELKLTIKQLAIRRATVNLRVEETAIGDRTYKLEDQSFVMTDLVMTNLRGTADKLSEEITRRLTEHVSDQVKVFVAIQIKNRVKDELKAKASEKLNELLEEKLGDKLKSLKF